MIKEKISESYSLSKCEGRIVEFIKMLTTKNYIVRSGNGPRKECSATLKLEKKITHWKPHINSIYEFGESEKPKER